MLPLPCLCLANAGVKHDRRCRERFFDGTKRCSRADFIHSVFETVSECPNLDWDWIGCFRIGTADKPRFVDNEAGGYLCPNVCLNAVFATSLAYWAQNVFQMYTGSAQIALIFSMEPVFASIFAWIALKEQLSLLGWIGGACIFLSMLVADSNVSIRSLRNAKSDIDV